MDQMLPSPGFSIPSIGTPLHQPEEDQQIIGNHFQQFSQPSLNMSNMGGGGLGNQMHINSGSGTGIGLGMQSNMGGLPSLMSNTTPRPIHHSYQPSYSTPQSMMQPQTPVIHTFFLSFYYV